MCVSALMMEKTLWNWALVSTSFFQGMRPAMAKFRAEETLEDCRLVLVAVVAAAAGGFLMRTLMSRS